MVYGYASTRDGQGQTEITVTAKDGTTQTFEADAVLSSIGGSPATEKITFTLANGKSTTYPEGIPVNQ